jgi:ketopantoate reductase
MVPFLETYEERIRREEWEREWVNSVIRDTAERLDRDLREVQEDREVREEQPQDSREGDG